MALVKSTVERHVALVTLDDARRRNIISLDLSAELTELMDRFESDPEVKAVVITGAPPAFCSGADVANLGHLSSEAGSQERSGITGLYEGFLRVFRSSLPTVAAVNGPAVGAGLNLALACDVRVAAESARFDPRFLRIGLHPGGGHVWMLERAVGPQAAAAMMLFGHALDGPEAVARGLAWECVPDEECVPFAVDLAARGASVPKELVARAKQTLRAAPWQADFAAAVALEVEHQTWSFGQGWFGAR